MFRVAVNFSPVLRPLLRSVFRRQPVRRELAAKTTTKDFLLSRDRPLLMHRKVRHGFCPRADDAGEQTREVLRRFEISASEFAAFSRCLRCNTPLEAVAKEVIEDRLEPLTRKHFEEFRRCRGCGRIFWRGSHAERLEELVRRFAAAAA